ncbi:MAG: hypothetical protein OXG51_10830, partial [Gammaproteobacteria bacterium]|nr:hypothetical protein [Gammaproteobacteria bacterium]
MSLPGGSTNHGGSANFEVCFSGTAARHTATTAIPAGSDYQVLDNGSPTASNCVNVNFLPTDGRSSSTRAGIRVRGDADYEPDETVIATLRYLNDVPISHYPLGTSTATHVIRNDDAQAA